MNIDAKTHKQNIRKPNTAMHQKKTMSHKFIPEMHGWYNILKSINMIHHINKMKDKNHRFISIKAEKAFHKIQHLFLIKPLIKVDIEGT